MGIGKVKTMGMFDCIGLNLFNKKNSEELVSSVILIVY